jgi:N-acetyl-alpha-D-glucosaminyl L-malate synthase BshA
LASALLEIEREHGLDIIHAHYGIPHAAVAFLARAAAAAPPPAIVTTLHGTDVTRLAREPAHLPMTQFCVGASDIVTTPSAALAETARVELTLGADFPIDVVPNFVDPDVFHPAARRESNVLDRHFRSSQAGLPTVLHVSNLRPVKRVRDALEAFAHAHACTELPRLMIVGDGPDRVDLETRARQLGIEERVAFIGERREIADLVRQADVFLLTSENESFGLAALEALASGVPVVATRAGGISEVVRDGETGLLAEVGDVRALSDALTRVLSDAELHERFAAAAVDDARARFRPAPIIDRYETLYRCVADSAGGPRAVGDIEP